MRRLSGLRFLARPKVGVVWERRFLVGCVDLRDYASPAWRALDSRRVRTPAQARALRGEAVGWACAGVPACVIEGARRQIVKSLTRGSRRCVLVGAMPRRGRGGLCTSGSSALRDHLVRRSSRRRGAAENSGGLTILRANALLLYAVSGAPVVRPTVAALDWRSYARRRCYPSHRISRRRKPKAQLAKVICEGRAAQAALTRRDDASAREQSLGSQRMVVPRRWCKARAHKATARIAGVMSGARSPADGHRQCPGNRNSSSSVTA